MERKISTPKLKRIFNRLTELRGKCRNNGQRYKVDKALKPCREELIRRERNAEKKNYSTPRQLPRSCSSSYKVLPASQAGQRWVPHIDYNRMKEEKHYKKLIRIKVCKQYWIQLISIPIERQEKEENSVLKINALILFLWVARYFYGGR